MLVTTSLAMTVPIKCGRSTSSSDDNALPETMRWEYGKVVKVHGGKELLDIDLDNGGKMRAVPTFDIIGVC